MKKFILLLINIHCSLLTVHLSEAQIIHVPTDQPTIQTGITAASAGDTVLVAEGTYYENINFWGKAITVASHFIIDADTNHINNTIINGSQPGNPDFASVVSFTTGEDTTSVICGFTITGGTGLLDASIPARLGGGIVCINAGAKICHNKIIANEVDHQAAAFGAGIACTMYLQSKWIVIEHNVIADNHNHVVIAASYGGGIFIGENTGTNIELRARVSHNTIENNSCYSDQQRADGGGIRIEGSDGVSTMIDFNHNLVRNNYIRGSSTRGAGLCGISAGADIANNVFSGNYIDTTSIQFRGSAICFKFPYHWVNIVNNQILDNISPIDYSDCTGAVSIIDGDDIPVVVEKNIFTNNEAYHGAGFYSRGAYNLIVSNNIFSGNSAYKGAALASYHNTGDTLNRPLIVNNTFFGNSATNRGAAISFIGELNVPVILNCIFRENQAPLGNDIRNESGLELVVAYSDIDTIGISGLWSGEGNFNADPEFISQDSLYHLSPASPCINTGIASLEVGGTVYYAPWVDYEGDWRPDPASDAFDVGADEYYQVPDAPVANQPQETGNDYFNADWEESPWAQRYYLDVSEDPDFGDFVEGYENLDVGNVTSCLVEGLDPIPYYYRIRAHNSAGVSENSNVISVLSVNTDEFRIQNSEFKIDIYPNPTYGIFNLRFTLYNLQSVSLKIFDLHGREVATVPDKKLPAGEHSVQFDLSNLPAGIYLLSAKTSDLTVTQKLIIYH